MFQQWLSKLITGVCGVGIMMKLWKFQDHSKCPRCQQDNEDTSHVLRCQHTTANEKWRECIKELSTWMEENDAHPDLRESIINNLSSWRNDTETQRRQYQEDLINRAEQIQNRIGWKGFIEGFIAKEWRQCQQKHLEKSRKSPSLWMAKLQNKIWQIAWTMWDHRNKHLHEDNNHIHATSLAALNEQIEQELEIGRSTLPQRYERLFRRQRERMERDTIEQKKQWLTSVWAARDKYNECETQGQNEEVKIFYDRWRNRHTRQDG